MSERAQPGARSAAAGEPAVAAGSVVVMTGSAAAVVGSVVVRTGSAAIATGSAAAAAGFLTRRSLRAALGLALVASACGAPKQRSWIERDDELGRSTFDEGRGLGGDDGGADRSSADGSSADGGAGRDGLGASPEAQAGARAWGAVERALREHGRVGTAQTRRALARALAELPPAGHARLDAAAPEIFRVAGGGEPALAQRGVLIALAQARRALHAEQRARAAAALALAEQLLPRATSAADPAAAAELAGELAALAAAGGPALAAVQPTKVAVLLPLSGRFAAVGAELRRAVESLPPSGVQWQFLDTRGDPAGAQAAVEQAADGGAVAALGPAGDREALAAAKRAAQRGLPIALLAPGDGGDAGLGVFRLAWSPQDEARAVAAWAAANDYQSVAVLAPRDDVGELTSAAFVAAAGALGLTVAARGEYDAAGGSVEADLKRFLNLVPAENPRLAAHLRRGGKRAWQTFVPDVAFSLLYVPDRAARAALIAAFLPYLGIELRTEEIMDPERLRRKYRGVIPQVVQLVGGAGWNERTLPLRGGQAVQGALIFDVCTAQRDDVAGELAAELEARLGHAPTSAAAQAYDAAAWMAQAVTAARAAGRGHRAGVRAELMQTRLEAGACGPLSVGADAEVRRESATLQVDGEELVLAP